MNSESRVIAYVGMWGAIVAALIVESTVTKVLFMLLWLTHFIMFIKVKE